ncbi:Fic/DOC family protein [uncultured archaeon]|nr:Fic/DOC family protein [uncultured archaeon]
MKNYIDSKIKREINDKLDRIKSHPECYEKRRKIVSKELRTIGDIFSFWIENPELRRRLYLENKSPETLKKLSRKGIQNMHNGWNYLTNPNLTRNLIFQLGENDFEVIKSLNALVLGVPSRKNYGFRTDRVTLNCEDYMPAEPEEISERMQKADYKIKNDYPDNFLESAIRWHLEGAAIQPFGEGNKRTFRLIQDKILDENGLPPVIIPAGEAKYYLNLLCKTFPAYEKGDLESQRPFYDYCASKVNNGLDEILGDLVFSSSC